MRFRRFNGTRVLAASFMILIFAVPLLSIRPAFAAVIFEDGFETGDLSKWSPTGGSPSVTGGDAHHGTYKAVLDAAGQYAQVRFAGNDHVFMRAYVMFKSLPASGQETTILGVYNWASSRYMAEARVGNFSGTNIVKWRLRYYDNGVQYTVTSEQQKPILNAWYCVEVEGKSNSTTNSEARLYINGNELTDVTQTGKNNNLQINCGYIWANSAVTRWYDCVVIKTVYTGTETCTLSVSTLGQGLVSLNAAGPYSYGDVVELTAVPSLGWSFDSWSGDLSGSANPETILMDGNKTVTATFTQNEYALTVNAVGSGSVTPNNTGPYYYSDVVELTAVPSTGWSFDSWSDDLSGSTNPNTILIEGDKTVTATFTQDTYSLTVNAVGSGSVNLNNSGPYHYGDIVELTAASSVGWSFDQWSGDQSGSTNPVRILMDGDKAATATFVRSVYGLTVNTVGNGNVNLNNSGPYYYGDVVELTAVPYAGWSFDSWSGTLSGSVNPETILIDDNKIVTANFSQIVTSDIAVLTVNTSKTIVGEGYSMTINVTVENQGDSSEIFHATVYANSTELETREITLPSGSSTTITLTWNTTGFDKGNYTIYAYSWPLPNEVDTTDNTFIDGNTVVVAMVGDVAGGPGTFPDTAPDGKVDIKDLATIAKCYGAVYPSPMYYPNSDLNDDGKIDIKDLAMVAKNYGK